MLVPELSLTIPNMYNFTKWCGAEPFLKVLDISDIENNPKELDYTLEARWDDHKHDQRTVMRTTAFGMSKGPLEMCVREGNQIKSKQREVKSSYTGVQEEILVSLTLSNFSLSLGSTVLLHLG